MALCMCGCGVTLGEAPSGSEGGGGGGGGDGKSDDDGAEVTSYCKQIDIVFAIANTDGSTDKEQQALRDEFSSFANKLLDITSGLDFRVALVDGCPLPASFHTRGLTRECAFAGGKPWIDSSSPELANEFSCVAEIDSSTALCLGDEDDEQPATTAVSALEPAWAGPGMPNEGFLRSDALLAVIVLTAEDEFPLPAASAQAIYDRFLAVKGDPEKMVFVGLGGKSSCGNDYGGAEDADTLQDITQHFRDNGHGSFIDLCDDPLERGLNKVVGAIESACEDW